MAVPIRSAWGFVMVLGLMGCGQPTTEPVTSALVPPRAGETSVTAKPAPPSVQTKVAPLQPATGASPPVEKERQERQEAEAAQWEQWYATARESSDVSVRLQALETWAQQPSDQIDPVTYGLVDQDDSMRQRAQELYEQQLTREAMTAPSEQDKKEP